MGGYMGFGMQSWIYKQRPRKPFDVKRKPSFTSIPKYERGFKIQPSKSSSPFYIVISILLLGLFFTIFQINMSEVLKHSSEMKQVKAHRIENENFEAFNFLMLSGESRFRGNNYEGAYSEFKLAYKINSKNEELNALILETLSILCFEKQKYCNELDNFNN